MTDLLFPGARGARKPMARPRRHVSDLSTTFVPRLPPGLLQKYMAKHHIQLPASGQLSNPFNGQGGGGQQQQQQESPPPLVNNWGDVSCNGWIQQSPARCSAGNYKVNCAKACSGR